MMDIAVLLGDITKIKDVECIVNAANTSLLGGGGVDGAIHRAGGSAILEECRNIRAKQGGCKVGEAVITTGGNLFSKYVIHTVGPIWQGGHRSEEELLEKSYTNTLLLAEKSNIKSLAFPNISTGVYNFPKELAAGIAIKTIQHFSEKDTQIEKLIFICFDQENYEIYKRLLED